MFQAFKGGISRDLENFECRSRLLEQTQLGVLVALQTVSQEFLIWAETLTGWVTSGKPFALPVGLLTPLDKIGLTFFKV